MKDAKYKKKKVFSSSLGLLMIFLLGSAFVAPLNNSKSETTKHNDVVSSKIAKKTARTIKSIKEGQNKDDKDGKSVEVEKPVVQAANQADSSDDTLTKIKNLSPSKIKTAASSESKAAEMIQSQTNLSASQSQKAASELFSDSKFSNLRSDINSGNWIGAYAQYQKLSHDGSIKELQASLGN